MSRSRIVLVVLALAAVALAPAASPTATPAPSIRFAPNVVVDPMRLGGEPIMVTDSKGNIYISSIIGFSNHTSFLWKSEDGGESFDLLRLDTPGLQRPNKTVGGGDSALIVGPPAPGYKDDTLIFIDLEGLATFGTGTTFDGGNTFVNDNPYASGDQPIGDRQWGGHWRDPAGIDHYYNFFNGIVGGYAIIETTDYGKTWKDWKRDVTQATGASRPGPLMVDPKTGELMLTWTYDSGNTGGAGFTRCTQNKVCTDTLIAELPNHNTNNTFVTGARDRQGNLYVAFSGIPRGSLNPARDPTRIYMSVSKNKGQTWSKPVVASGSLPTASMPTIVAGDAGRVSIAYYATSRKGDPNFNAGPWHVAMSQSTNALSAKPAFSVARVSEHTNHINPICTNGLSCTVDPEQRNDRNLIDFLYAAIGRNGETLVTWADTANQLGPNPPAGPSITMFAKQVSGSSLYARPGKLTPPPQDRREYSLQSNAIKTRVSTTIPLNWRLDSLADAAVPRHGPGGPGAQHPSLDILSSWLEAAGPRTMRGVMMLRDTFNVAPPAPYTNNFYMFWWWSKNKVYYAAAEVGPAEAGTSQQDAISDCYAGQPGWSNPASPRWAIYVATAVPPPDVTRIDCHLDLAKGRLTMEIPLDTVEGTIGDTLYSVTASASAITIPNVALNAVAQLPEEIDQVTPFTYRVGSARQQKTILARR
ncbi:MAG: hypothetical protein ACRDJM_02130 [Actinomycetota bacterium]